MHTKNWRFLFARLLAFLLLSTGARPEIVAETLLQRPSPNSTVSPVSINQPRLLAMLWQVTKQLEQDVAGKDLGAIHNEDVVLGAASKELLAQAETIASDRPDKFRASLTAFCQSVSALHLAADLNQQTRSEVELGKVLDAFEKVKGHFGKQVVADAQAFLDSYTCPMHRDVIGKRTDSCPKCGMPLDQLCRILPSSPDFPAAGQQSVRASVKIDAPLVVGTPVSAILQLQKMNGDPVLPSDLIETHTKKIHLFIIDNSLTDYHHEHPALTRNPGEYAFNFTPTEPGSYRVWADVRPNPLGLQEYAMTDIPGTTPGQALSSRETSLKATVDGLNYELILAQKTIQAGRPALAKLQVTTPNGEGFRKLEPIMATFAHLVGFNQDYKTVLHVHPKGSAVLDPAARGGPELEFQIYTLRPGFVRLFAQVQIDGRSRFAPFGIQVVP